MQLEHQFSVPVPVAQAWDLLLDVERIAPCMPGATVESFDGETISGRFKVKVGPIQVTYTGTATYTEKDESARRAVLSAAAKEARGPGTAAATVVARLVGKGSTTDVLLTTDLDITGRPAQFGRGVMAEVGTRLLGKFADCLAAELGGEATGARAVTATSTAAPGEQTSSTARDIAASTSTAATQATPPPPPLRRVPAGDGDAVDLLDGAGAPLLKKVLPAVGVAVLLLVVWRLLARPRG